MDFPRRLLGAWACLAVVGVYSAFGQLLGGYTNVPAFPGVVLTNPVCLATPPGETNRVFVVELPGRIVVLSNLANPTRTVFLDISSRVTFGGESGMLGLVFHPEYATNGYFYVSYRGPATNYASGAHNILARYQTSATNANRGDPNSELRLIVQYDQYANHNGGDLHFGSDGYLYLSAGDGGSLGDLAHNSQRISSSLFSGILRIDIDNRPGNLPPNPSVTLAVTTNYSIPYDNPFVGATSFDGLPVDPTQVRTEFWAVGLRNPWRFSFDPVTGILYCGDVGEERYEEINVITRGGNYGWSTYEGLQSPPFAVNTNGQPAALNPIFPIAIMPHLGPGIPTNDASRAVIGGIVYRGSRWPELHGAYIFADFFTGNLWRLRYDGAVATSREWLFFADGGVTTFGTDPRNGDVLYATFTLGIRRIIASRPAFNEVTVSSGTLKAAGVGPPGGNYVMLTSSNLALPILNWTPVETNAFDSLGNFSFSRAVVPDAAFYQLQLQ